MNEAKSKKTVAKPQGKSDNTKGNAMENAEIEKALQKNDEDWLKRMLLLVLTMIIALLSVD